VTTHLPAPINDEACPRASIVEITAIVTKRWTSGIMLALSRGATRFSQIQTAVEHVSGRMVSARLRELELHGMVERVVTPTMPVSVSYALTHKGRVALASLQSLATVGYEESVPAAESHVA
jgi:DNA-binding HxlR family transcriptional regulator